MDIYPVDMEKLSIDTIPEQVGMTRAVRDFGRFPP